MKMSNTDKLYIAFVESMDMGIPDNDCSDYRDQDDYKAIIFLQSRIELLEKVVRRQSEAVDGLLSISEESHYEDCASEGFNDDDLSLDCDCGAYEICEIAREAQEEYKEIMKDDMI